MRFFKKYPRKGDNITMNGFARGLRNMALALERMEVQNGRVEWTFGIPRLVFEGGGGGTFNHPFKVLRVPVADPDDDYLTVSKGRLHFWKGDSWKISTTEITESDNWTVTTDTGGAYTPEYIYAQLTYSGGWSWSLGHDTTNPQDRATNADDQEQRTWIIAYMDTDGSIDQRINQDIYETMGS